MKGPGPLTRYCDACNCYHGGLYICPHYPAELAAEIERQQKESVAFSSPAKPILPGKIPDDQIASDAVGILWTDGKGYGISAAQLAGSGGDLAKLVAKIKAESFPMPTLCAPTAAVADSFFFAFVAESMRVPIRIPFSEPDAPKIVRDSYLLAAMVAMFGDTDPRVELADIGHLDTSI